jgi:4,5-dihydroxyphthalate decarboxylase
MTARKLTIAIVKYGVTHALHDGTVRPDGLNLNFAQVEPITAAMRRMVRGLDFDVCEMAFTTYLCAKALGHPITALPVFLTRNFHHWAAFHNVKAGIKAPKDLEGRTVAVNRGYTVTTGLWVRGILQSEYGVDLDRITWAPTDEEHVAEYRAPPNVDYRWRGKSMAELLSGPCDAAIGDVRVDSDAIKPLIADARAAGFAWFRKTGIYPINHGVVIKTATLEGAPWIAEALFDAFKAAKAAYLSRLSASGGSPPADAAARELGAVVGDPFPFGVEANRKTLEAMARFAVEQRVIPKPLGIEDLFAPGTLTCR